MDYAIDPAHGFVGFGDERFRGVGDGEVGGNAFDGGGAGAGGGDLGEFGFGAAVQGQVGSAGGEADGNFAANAAGGAGDEEFIHVRRLTSVARKWRQEKAGHGLKKMKEDKFCAGCHRRKTVSSGTY